MSFKLEELKLIFVANTGDDSISIVDTIKRKVIKKILLFPSDGKTRISDIISKKPVVGPHSIRIDKSCKNIYSINCFDNSISVVDTISGEVKESFFAGAHPNDMVLNCDETYGYVTNGDCNSVSVIDIFSKRIIAQIASGAMPHGICISPNGEYVYTANMESDSVSIIDTWSNSKVSNIKVEKCPTQVSISKDGRYLYVVCSYLGSDRNGVVSIISTTSYKVMKNIDVGIIPVQAEISHDNQFLYVTNMGSNDMYVIDLNRFQVIKKIKTGNMSRGIAIDDTGLIYIANSQDNNVSVISNSLESMYNIEVGIEPTSMLYMDKTIL